MISTIWVRSRYVVWSVAAAALWLPSMAFAHVGQGDISRGFVAGVEHPLFGLDHVVAMVAVGIWGAQLGQPAIWILPITFPLVMSVGAILGGLDVRPSQLKEHVLKLLRAAADRGGRAGPGAASRRRPAPCAGTRTSDRRSRPARRGNPGTRGAPRRSAAGGARRRPR